MGGGILNIIINKAAGNVNQTSALTTSGLGVLTLTSGTLVTNGNDLTLNGGVAATAGNINATTPTFLTVGGAGALVAPIPFTINSILSNLTLNRNAALLSTSNTSISDGGLMTITRGTLTAPITPLGVYDVLYNNTVALTTGSEIPLITTALRHLTHAGTATVNLNSNATINGDLTINTNTFAASTRNVSLVGDFVSNAAFTQTTGTFTFLTRTPSNVHTHTGTSTSTFGGLTINGDLTMSNLTTTLANSGSSLTIEAGSSLNQTSGTFSFTGTGTTTFSVVNNGNTIQFNNLVNGTNDTMTAPSNGAFSVSGNWSGNGRFVHNGSTVNFNGTTTLSGSAKTFNNLTVATGSSLSGAISFTMLGNMINDGLINFTAGTLTWNSNGTFSGTSAASLNSLTVSATRTLNLTLGADLALLGNLTLTGSVNQTNTNDLTIGGNMTGNGNFTSTGRVIITGAAAVMNGNGTKNFQDFRVTGTLTAGANTSYSITNGGSLDVETGATLAALSGGSSVTTISGVVDVINTGTSTTLNALTINGTLNSLGTIFLNSNFTNNGIFNHGNGTINFNNTGLLTKSITSSGTIEFYNISIDNNGNAIDVTNNVTGLLNLRGVLTLTDAVLDADGAADDRVLVVMSLGDTPTQDGSIAAMSATASVSGNITVHRYMDYQSKVNRYISAPVSGRKASDWFDDFTTPRTLIQWYNEWVNGTQNNGYATGGANTNLISGKGYLAMPLETVPVTWDLTGPLTLNQSKGDVDLQIGYDPTPIPSPADDGWNLVGNPYPSAIIWNTSAATAWSITNVDPVIYVPDISGNVFKSWDGSTNMGDLPNGKIAMGQAFWIKANAVGAQIIVHEPSKTTSIGGQFYRKSNSDFPAGLKVSLAKGDVKDNSFLLLREGTTDNYDRGFDVPKMEGEMMAISFQDPQGLKLGHYATSEIQNAIPINIHAANEGEYAISFESIRGYAGFDELFLVDTYLGKSQSLAGNTPYSFSVTSNTNTKSGRFYISKDLSSVKEKELMISVWPNPVETIFDLEINTNHTVFAAVMNSKGETLISSQIAPMGGMARAKIDMTAQSTGLYFLKATIDGRVSVVKLLKK